MTSKAGDNSAWRNRIIAHGEEAPNQLIANPRNWRIHPKNQQEPLHGALETIGWLQDIIVNVRSGQEWPPEERNVQTVVDGHLRITLALRHDQPSVPVKYVDLSPSEEALALATLDPLAALAVADKEKLDGLLRDLPPVDVRLQEMLAGLANNHGLYKAANPLERQDTDGWEKPDGGVRIIILFDEITGMEEFWERLGNPEKRREGGVVYEWRNLRQ